MNISKTIIALGVTGALAGLANAAPVETVVSKKITLTAQINDGIFVSKPDGKSWYSTEELVPVDYKQQKFSKTLPIRVWSKNAEFNVSLAQPLKLSNGSYEMANTTVSLGSSTGENSVNFGTQQKIKQVVKEADGFDEIHDLRINADAPTQIGTLSAGGSYSGDLVMIFEPVSSTGS